MLGVSLSWVSKTRLKYAFRRRCMSVLHDSLTPRAELRLSHVTGYILALIFPLFYHAPLCCILRLRKLAQWPPGNSTHVRTLLNIHLGIGRLP